MLEKTEDPIVPGLPQALTHSSQHKYFPPDILASWFSQKKILKISQRSWYSAKKKKKKDFSTIFVSCTISRIGNWHPHSF
jgi:hypothetical protein